LRSAPPVPWWRKVAAQFRDPLVYLLVVGLLGWRATRTSQMVTQYPWLYEKVTPFSWRDRVQPSGGTA